MTLTAILAGAPLRQGASGEDVRKLQLALRALGYGLSGTGYFGPATDTAVEDFQRKRGMAVTGVVDAAVAATIDKAIQAVAGAAPVEQPPQWLTVALAHVGLKEAPGSKNNSELVKMLQEVEGDYQSDATPWCGYLVGYCLMKAGCKPSSSTGWALSYAQGWGVKLRGPAVGAIAVKTRNGGGHVTFVAGRAKDGRLACCGGNQNDMVNVAPYAESAFNRGFWWPKEAPLPKLTGIKSLPIVNASGATVREA